jgi:UDP-N-acetylglucosamine:LPS N-acetylglucosamine transferase
MPSPKRVLIITSSAGTAHDSAAYALQQWIGLTWPATVVQVEHLLENASVVMRCGVALYNWIQKQAPWLMQAYWRLAECEDLIKPGSVIFGRRYAVRLLKRFRPDVLIATHPHLNRGHFDLAKRVLGPQLRCITCCTELAGGFGFSRNWISLASDRFWTLTPEVDRHVAKQRVWRRFPAERLQCLGPLLYPAFHQGGPAPATLPPGLPLLMLASGANGANNHTAVLKVLLPLAGRVRVAALCGRRESARRFLLTWRQKHPELELEVLGFQEAAAMAHLLRSAWAVVARPGARTATEALVIGCPLIFNCWGSTMPQELLAVRYYAARGLNTPVRTPERLAALVSEWLDAPATYAAMRQRFQQHRLPSAPEAVLAGLLN